jgi:hypothetical protein
MARRCHVTWFYQRIDRGRSLCWVLQTLHKVCYTGPTLLLKI